MEQNFQNILSSLLEEYDKSKDIEAVLNREDGLSEAGKQLLNETTKTIDAFNEAYNELQDAKDNGMTTNEWLEEELGKHPEEVIKPILESVNDKLNKKYEE
jgi:uncharacterized protein YaaR (DUF327 family)